MILNKFQYRNRTWIACLEGVLEPDVETGIEVVFVKERPGVDEDTPSKYAWPVDPILLQAIAEDAVRLDPPRLRRMLRSAMKESRQPAGIRSGPGLGDRLVSFVRHRLQEADNGSNGEKTEGNGEEMGEKDDG